MPVATTTPQPQPSPRGPLGGAWQKASLLQQQQPPRPPQPPPPATPPPPQPPLEDIAPLLSPTAIARARRGPATRSSLVMVINASEIPDHSGASSSLGGRPPSSASLSSSTSRISRLSLTSNSSSSTSTTASVVSVGVSPGMDATPNRRRRPGVDPIQLAFVTTCKLNQERVNPMNDVRRVVQMQNMLGDIYKGWASGSKATTKNGATLLPMPSLAGVTDYPGAEHDDDDDDEDDGTDDNSSDDEDDESSSSNGGGGSEIAETWASRGRSTTVSPPRRSSPSTHPDTSKLQQSPHAFIDPPSSPASDSAPADSFRSPGRSRRSLNLTVPAAAAAATATATTTTTDHPATMLLSVYDGISNGRKSTDLAITSSNAPVTTVTTTTTMASSRRSSDLIASFAIGRKSNDSFTRIVDATSAADDDDEEDSIPLSEIRTRRSISQPRPSFSSEDPFGLAETTSVDPSTFAPAPGTLVGTLMARTLSRESLEKPASAPEQPNPFASQSSTRNPATTPEKWVRPQTPPRKASLASLSAPSSPTTPAARIGLFARKPSTPILSAAQDNQDSVRQVPQPAASMSAHFRARSPTPPKRTSSLASLGEPKQAPPRVFPQQRLFIASTAVAALESSPSSNSKIANAPLSIVTQLQPLMTTPAITTTTSAARQPTPPPSPRRRQQQQQQQQQQEQPALAKKKPAPRRAHMQRLLVNPDESAATAAAPPRKRSSLFDLLRGRWAVTTLRSPTTRSKSAPPVPRDADEDEDEDDPRSRFVDISAAEIFTSPTGEGFPDDHANVDDRNSNKLHDSLWAAGASQRTATTTATATTARSWAPRAPPPSPTSRPSLIPVPRPQQRHLQQEQQQQRVVAPMPAVPLSYVDRELPLLPLPPVFNNNMHDDEARDSDSSDDTTSSSTLHTPSPPPSTSAGPNTTLMKHAINTKSLESATTTGGGSSVNVPTPNMPPTPSTLVDFDVDEEWRPSPVTKDLPAKNNNNVAASNTITMLDIDWSKTPAIDWNTSPSSSPTRETPPPPPPRHNHPNTDFGSFATAAAASTDDLSELAIRMLRFLDHPPTTPSPQPQPQYVHNHHHQHLQQQVYGVVPQVRNHPHITRPVSPSDESVSSIVSNPTGAVNWMMREVALGALLLKQQQQQQQQHQQQLSALEQEVLGSLPLRRTLSKRGSAKRASASSSSRRKEMSLDDVFRLDWSL